MKTLILFSTRDGQTREIAAYLASELKELGIYSDVVNLNRAEEIAAGVRSRGDWRLHSLRTLPSGAGSLCEKHTAVLNTLPGAFYSVNLVARKAEKRTPQTNSYTRKFCSARRGSQTCAPSLPVRYAILATAGMTAS